MRRGIRWYVTGNLMVVGAILGAVLFWQAVEAPHRPVESGAETPATPTPDSTMPALSAQADSPLPTATSTPESTKAPPTPPTAVAGAQLVPPSSQLTVRVPILMYHRIDRLPANPDALRVSLSIAPADFDSQVHFLKERGFTSLTLTEVYEALQGKRTLPPKPVALTFDDGYADNYANAFPILKKYGFLGTFFVLTDVAGTGEYMSWDQLEEMAAAGMKIEVHGRAHLDVSRMTTGQVASQVQGARDAIRARLGVESRFYSYPSGKYNESVIDVVKTSGFLAAVTVNYGSDHTLQKAFELKRVRIDGRESFAVFARKVGENP
ncbi:MAG: polysaccharide deacetylase family protein [Chloroflexi bacterium]|nr:polysaccharide deacetylase family protein [Chloroflexota bacterium]